MGDDELQLARLGQGRVEDCRVRLRRRLLELRPEVNEPDLDPWCQGLDKIFVPRATLRTCDRCEEFRSKVERVEVEPLGPWPDPA